MQEKVLLKEWVEELRYIFYHSKYCDSRICDASCKIYEECDKLTDAIHELEDKMDKLK